MSDSADAAPTASARLRRAVRERRAKVFHTLWELDESTLRRPTRVGLTVLRLSFVTLDSFFRERLHTRSAALAFFTVLSVVPAAALIFSLAKPLGAYDLIIDETIRPLLNEAFHAPDGAEVPPGVATLKTTVEELIHMVQRTNVFGLGLLGFAVLLFTIRRVVTNTEASFDAIWGFTKRRRLIKALPGYFVVAIWSPLALVLATTMTTARQAQPFMALLYDLLDFPVVGDLLVFLVPPLVVWLAMLPLYLVLPNTRVRKRSAMIGAAIGGLGWYALQVLHVRFQIGVARQNALYSGFGAFPIFLLWLHLSWLWILLGAQVAAVHQNAPTLRQLARANLDDHLSRQAVALRAMIALAGHEGGERLRQLARDIGVAVAPLREVLDVLVDNALLRRDEDRYDPRYEAAHDPDATRVATVVEALGRGAATRRSMPWLDAERPVTEVLEKLHSAAETSAHNRTIAELRRASEANEAGS